MSHLSLRLSCVIALALATSGCVVSGLVSGPDFGNGIAVASNTNPGAPIIDCSCQQRRPGRPERRQTQVPLGIFPGSALPHCPAAALDPPGCSKG